MYENEIETNITWIPENTLKSVFRIHNVRNISWRGGGGGIWPLPRPVLRSVNAPGLPGGMLKFRIGSWVNFNTDWNNIENGIESV